MGNGWYYRSTSYFCFCDTIYNLCITAVQSISMMILTKCRCSQLYLRLVFRDGGKHGRGGEKGVLRWRRGGVLTGTVRERL